VVGSFTGGHITSDAGALLLREVEKATSLVERFARCFKDGRDQARVEHSVYEMIAQRVYGLCLGYEDIVDHDELRRDPLLALLVGKRDVLGQSRKRVRDRGYALAGKSTLNRLEGTALGEPTRYHKITYDTEGIDRFFVDHFLRKHRKEPQQIILDLDATDDPLHGNQEGRFFHGYYGHYCYLPLYIFCGKDLLCARLRPSDQDAAKGSLEEVERIVEQIRTRWPLAQILLRADSGFARDYLMDWCERQERVDYLFGLAQNKRLNRRIAKPLGRVRRKSLVRRKAVRTFLNFRYRTKETWSKKRRVVAKVEHLVKGANPRFVVTSLSKEQYDARTLYEDVYCARGEMENRIKEQQLDLFSDRTSAASMRANQLRLYFSSLAYTLTEELRHVGLCVTQLAQACASTIRNKLFKIGAHIEVTARRIVLRFSSGYPYADLFRRVLRAIHSHYQPLRC
jgi:hypothetical protein